MFTIPLTTIIWLFIILLRNICFCAYSSRRSAVECMNGLSHTKRKFTVFDDIVCYFSLNLHHHCHLITLPVIKHREKYHWHHNHPATHKLLITWLDKITAPLKGEAPLKRWTKVNNCTLFLITTFRVLFQMPCERSIERASDNNTWQSTKELERV